MAYPDAYCVKCGKHTATQQKHTVVLTNSARALKGVCADCSTEVYKILPKGKSYSTTVDSEAAYRKSFPDAFCVKCQEHTPTLRPETVVLHNGSRAMRGNCQKCGSDSYRILGKKPLEQVAPLQQVLREPDKHIAPRPVANDDRRIPMARRAEAMPKSNRRANAIAFTIVVSVVAAALAYSLI